MINSGDLLILRTRMSGGPALTPFNCPRFGLIWDNIYLISPINLGDSNLRHDYLLLLVC
jgi:hypothetical protein